MAACTPPAAVTSGPSPWQSRTEARLPPPGGRRGTYPPSTCCGCCDVRVRWRPARRGRCSRCMLSMAGRRRAARSAKPVLTEYLAPCCHQVPQCLHRHQGRLCALASWVHVLAWRSSAPLQVIVASHRQVPAVVPTDLRMDGSTDGWIYGSRGCGVRCLCIRHVCMDDSPCCCPTNSAPPHAQATATGGCARAASRNLTCISMMTSTPSTCLNLTCRCPQPQPTTGFGRVPAGIHEVALVTASHTNPREHCHSVATTLAPSAARLSLDGDPPPPPVGPVQSSVSSGRRCRAGPLHAVRRVVPAAATAGGCAASARGVHQLHGRGLGQEKEAEGHR